MKQMRVGNTVKRRGVKTPGSAPSGRQTMLPPRGLPKTEASRTGSRKNLRQRNREAIERPRYEAGVKTAEIKPSKQGERASPEKWKKINRRAGELAMIEGKPLGGVKKRHVRRAKRELLGLQTLPDPDDPLVRRKPGSRSRVDEKA